MTPSAEQRMMCGEELRLRLDRLQSRALDRGRRLSILLLMAWVLWPRHFFAPYLVGYLFWLGIVLGSIGLTMLHHLIGGSWGLVIRRPLEAGAATVPLFALLFLPIAFGIPVLYPWARPDAAERTERCISGPAYLNEPLFLLRAAGYFGLWTAIAFLLVGMVKPARPYERPSAEPATAAIERAGHRDSVCGEHVLARWTG